jgi:carboxypeptidase-like protein
MRAVMALTLAAASMAAAQSSTRTIKGTVVDSANHKPLSEASVYIMRTPTGQRSGNDGTFHITADTDIVILMIRRPGYVPALVSIPPGPSAAEADAGAISIRQVKSDSDRAEVEDIDRKVFPELGRFYDRKTRYAKSGAVFLAPDELQRIGGSLFSYIRQKPGFHFLCYVTQRGEFDCGEQRSRGRTSITNPNPTSAEQPPCELDLWFNSVGVGPQKTLDQVQMGEVLAVEAYPNPSVTPPEFAGSPCAAVMLWMKPTGM